jgi:hypothetical protein
MLSATYSKKEYAILGRLLALTEPATAERLITTYLPRETAIQSDLSVIPAYFITFCDLRGIHPEDYIGPLFKTSKVDIRRLFVAVMLKMYYPGMYNMPIVDFSLIGRTGFSKAITQLFQAKKENIFKTIREVIIWKNEYDDFAFLVDQAIEQLVTKEQGGLRA